MKTWRINLILLFIFLFGGIIIGRLVYIQIVQKEFWQALAHGQQKFFKQVLGERGEIFFQGGEPLAINREFIYVFISPAKIEEPKMVVNALSEILNLNKEFISKKIARENSFFELIKNRLTLDEIANLEKLELSGIYFGRKNLRYYPQKFLASQLIGFVGGGGDGQYGIEGYYNNILQGEDGFQRGKRDVFGRLLGEIIKNGGQAGHDLILTIDYNIQFTSERLLQTAHEDLNIKSGQIIVMNPISGEILAMANFPNFNPNYFSEFNNLGIFKNSTTQKIFEPGSVMKAFTMAIALEEGKITPETTYVDKGMVKIDPHIIRNFDYRIWGEKTMAEILAKSINTGSVYAARLVGLDTFVKHLENFGFFDLTRIELQGEVAFYNNELRTGKEINLATASFGHGISITPIQLTRAFAVIANKGKLVNPFIVKTQEEILLYEQIISRKTASQLTTMLIETVNHPFIRRAQIPGYHVAGKTGTAEVPWIALGYDKPGYSDELIHTFVGFAPAYNPQFLIMVKLDQPQGVRTASLSAAPIFQELARHIINLWQIPPDYEP